MKVVVLNGSPKGKQSVTLQSLRYIAALRPDWDLDVHDIGQTARMACEREDWLAPILDAVRAADAVVWSTPVYHLLVPSQMKHFLELCAARGEDAFRGKIAAGFLTSIHFCDHTAASFLAAVSEDLGLGYYGTFSANMHDLLEKGERRRLLSFADSFAALVRTDPVLPRSAAPVVWKERPLGVGPAVRQTDLGGKRVLLLADRLESGSTLEGMVRRLSATFSGGTVDLCLLEDVDTKGGCLGCCGCGFNNECSWDGRDGYREFFETRVKPADILVFAGAITGRALSWRWKEFFDRSFYNTHLPVYQGKQLGWLISGPLAQNGFLREVFESYADVNRGNNAGIVTDECGNGDRLGAELDGFAERIALWAKSGYVAPGTFRGIAGRKIFRDEVFSTMRLFFRADHKEYRRNGTYDFPQKRRGRMLVARLLWPVLGFKPIQRVVRSSMKKEMVKGHCRVVAEAVAGKV